jgi:hypothetical protein
MALAGAAFRSFFKIGPLAFVGIAWTLYENWERVKSFFASIWSAVEPHWLRFKAILDEYGITDKIVAGWNAAKALFENIWTIAEPHWNNFQAILEKYAVTDKIMSAWTFVRDFFSTLWSTALPHWNSFIEKIRALNIADKIMASWAKLKTFFTGFWDSVSPVIGKLAAPLSGLWNGAKSSVSSIGSLFSSDTTKPSIASKLPPLSGAKSASITKNQTPGVSEAFAGVASDALTNVVTNLARSYLKW